VITGDIKTLRANEFFFISAYVEKRRQTSKLKQNSKLAEGMIKMFVNFRKILNNC